MSGAAAASKIASSGAFGIIGKKQVEIASRWIGSAVAFGATAGMALCYATDWKVVVDFIPYYNGKFKNE